MFQKALKSFYKIKLIWRAITFLQSFNHSIFWYQSTLLYILKINLSGFFFLTFSSKDITFFVPPPAKLCLTQSQKTTITFFLSSPRKIRDTFLFRTDKSIVTENLKKRCEPLAELYRSGSEKSNINFSERHKISFPLNSLNRCA